MRCWPLVGVIAVMVSASGWAGTGSKPVPHKPGARTSQADVDRRVAKHEAEVRRLQQDVAKQESASKQAGERLQQQDQAIAELHKQLQQAHAEPAGGQH